MHVTAFASCTNASRVLVHLLTCECILKLEQGFVGTLTSPTNMAACVILQAAAFMKSQIDDAYDKWTTGFYDYIQSLQNKIP